MDTSLSRPVWAQIQSDKDLIGKIAGDYIKVRSHLKRFARVAGLDHQQLTLLHISNDKAEPTPELIRSIQGRPKRKGTTDARHLAYTGEILSRIRRITTALLAADRGRDVAAAEAAFLEKLPASVKPIVIHLSRVGGSNLSLDRAELQLTDDALEALRVLVNVALRLGVGSPEELLTNRYDLTQEIRMTVVDPAKWIRVTSVLSQVRRKMGIRSGRESTALPEEDLPPKLKRQLGRYLELAPTGAYCDPELLAAGYSANVEIRGHEETTIADNKAKLLQLLGELVTGGHDISEVGIEDLMRIEPAVSPDGTVIYNKYICPFRKRQREPRPGKAGGRDSERFHVTIIAIKSVAAYNGIFRFHEKFAETYEVHLDFKSRQKRSRAKKEAFPVEWLDDNLVRLKPRFEAIVKAKTFRTIQEDLQLCLFYTWTMTLRHTGIRQQGIRNCLKGWNIFFIKREAVRFRWRVDEIKNDKDFQQTIKRTHVNTCAALLDPLHKYKDHILPFLEQLAAKQGTAVEGQFFLAVGRSFKVRRFTQNSASFSSAFKYLSLKFLDFSGVPVHMRSKFSAHVIRGQAGDKMHDDYGVGVDSVSRFLGNNRRTTENSYLQKSRVDATPALDEAEERAAAIKERRLRELGPAAMTPKGQATPEAQVLKDALNDSMERERKMAEELAELRARNEILLLKLEDEVA